MRRKKKCINIQKKLGKIHQSYFDKYEQTNEASFFYKQHIKKVQKRKSSGYYICELTDGTIINFNKLCTEIAEFEQSSDMMCFFAANFETGEKLVLDIIPKKQIKRIVNNFSLVTLDEIWPEADMSDIEKELKENRKTCATSDEYEVFVSGMDKVSRMIADSFPLHPNYFTETLLGRKDGIKDDEE